MKRFAYSTKIIFIATIACLFAKVNCFAHGETANERLYMAIELNNVLCGYSVIDLSDSLKDGKSFQFIEQTAFISFHILGKDITQFQRFTYLIDPQSGNFVYHDSHHEQGEMVLESTQVVEGDSMVINSEKGRHSLYIPGNTILPNTQYYPYLLKDFNEYGVNERTYPVYDLRTGGIGSRIYKRVGVEVLELANMSYQALVLEETNPALGMSSKLWIDEKTGMRLKIESSRTLTMYLTDETVKDKIKTGDWDDVLFVKTNVNIRNIHNIGYMKVRIDLGTEPKSTMQDLNVPGQVFTGSVEDGEIRGFCEVAHKKYAGENAPQYPFRLDPGDNADAYLEASNNIESDDPVLIKKALEIVKGSENSWEAVCRISSWVDNNIDGAIIDGSARDTYDRGSGLCAAQSNLTAALFRAAGIPARVVWGVLYVPKDGGSFGHHAWNEVFMGDDGWIPIDVTIHETDYVNSGHIRLGEVKSYTTNIDYREIEILDYKEGGSGEPSF